MGEIADKARRALAQRVPVGSYNMATGQIEHRPADATDVAGMLEPLFDAITELEARLDAKLDGRN